jgi:signal peptidase I
MRATARNSILALLAVAVAATLGAATLRAASPEDPAGVPFLTFARAVVAGDYTLACAQISERTLREGAPGIPAVAPIRRACASELASEAEGIDTARYASMHIVAVQVKPGRARVIVQTTFRDIAPIETGTAIVEHDEWKIRELPGDARVGSSRLYRVPSASMDPTLQVGDTVLVDHAAYRTSRPAVGDIVVFHPPAGAESARACARRPPQGQACAVATRRTLDTTFIKRIVAGPGDRISIRDGRVVRNGTRAAEPFVTPCPREDESDLCDFPRTFKVAAGRYYVLGDFRGASYDSRFWGPVAARAIVGRVGRVFPRDPDPPAS